jgi:hypothetical protein
MQAIAYRLFALCVPLIAGCEKPTGAMPVTVPDGVKCFEEATYLRLQVGDTPFKEDVNIEGEIDEAINRRGFQAYPVVIDARGHVNVPIVQVRRLRRGFFERPYYAKRWMIAGGSVGDGEPSIEIPSGKDISKYLLLIRDVLDVGDSSKWRYTEISAKDIVSKDEPHITIKALDDLRMLSDRDDSQRILQLLKVADTTAIALRRQND